VGAALGDEAAGGEPRVGRESPVSSLDPRLTAGVLAGEVA
jgi:hypothetical protein